MEQQKENNQIVDEYINVLTSKLNEVTQESLVLKAQLNSVKKERDLLIEKVRELRVKEDEMKKPQSDFQNSEMTNEEVGETNGDNQAKEVGNNRKRSVYK